MKIAICDDENIFRSELKSMLVRYKTSRRVHIDIFEFNNGNELLNEEQVFDIIFLDYQMPDLDGMETARILRRRNCTCSIIFVTSFPDFVFEAFEVQPLQFYKKPIDENKLCDTIDRFIKNQKHLFPLIINQDGEQKIIASKDIVYIEGDGKYCNIRTTDNTFHSSKTVSGVLKLLPHHCFYRIHKSYAINLYCIESIKNDTIHLLNGEKAPISRNHKTDFKQAYRTFTKAFSI